MVETIERKVGKRFVQCGLQSGRADIEHTVIVRVESKHETSVLKGGHPARAMPEKFAGVIHSARLRVRVFSTRRWRWFIPYHRQYSVTAWAHGTGHHEPSTAYF